MDGVNPVVVVQLCPAMASVVVVDVALVGLIGWCVVVIAVVTHS